MAKAKTTWRCADETFDVGMDCARCDTSEGQLSCVPVPVPVHTYASVHVLSCAEHNNNLSGTLGCKWGSKRALCKSRPPGQAGLDLGHGDNHDTPCKKVPSWARHSVNHLALHRNNISSPAVLNLPCPDPGLLGQSECCAATWQTVAILPIRTEYCLYDRAMSIR